MNGGSIIPLYEHDFDPTYKLDQFPNDFECPSCMMIQLEMLQCKNCEQLCCKACLDSFSHIGSKNIEKGKYECTLCHKVDFFNNQNKILHDIL